MRGLLIDLDGVIWETDKAVPGAAETIAWCVDEGIPHLFVTNTTSRPRRLIADKLAGFGINVPAEKILTPPIAAGRWLAENAPGPTLLLVPDATKEDFETVQEVSAGDGNNAAAVVVGDIGQAWNYDTLNEAFRTLMREPPARLVALGMTRYWRADDGLRLDVAPFVKALEHAADCKAVVLGKPSADFFSIALSEIKCQAENTVMIGDDIVGDVAAAQRSGMQGILVKTGKFRPADLAGQIQPDAALDSIAELSGWWQSS